MGRSPVIPKDFVVSTRAAGQLGNAVCRYRLSANLTQASLAKSAGLRQATISKVEKGTDTTEIKTIYSICAALGLELTLQPRKKRSNVLLQPEDLF